MRLVLLLQGHKYVCFLLYLCVGTGYSRYSRVAVLCSHHGCSCGGSLRSHSCLVGLVLGGLNLGLQVGRGMEVLALLTGAAALDVVHAHSDSVISGVNHWTVTRMSKTAICLPSCTGSTLKLAAHLRGVVIKRVSGLQLLTYVSISFIKY